uniref:5'-deoxynucleotidase n=1 Tax=Kalanchoe fedtschenkoi TaxID=63787 RepID=A0A7N0T5W5_KALFE
MAVAPSSHCVPRLNRALPHHSAASFSTRAPVKSVSFLDSPPAPARLVSVRSGGSDQGDVSLIRDGAGEVGSKASGSPSSSSSSAAYAIDFLTLCHSLKTTKRKGWINHGINGPESIADHMYRMALMSLIAGDLPGVNRERCIKIAIVHDIAEAIVGDITPSDGVPKEEKSRREQAALLEMCKVLGGGMRAEEIQELWREYEDNASKEAKLVKDFDKVEMILQALEYEMEHGKVLDEFFQSTAGKFQTDIGKKWAAEVNSRRTTRLANDSHIN